MSLFFEHFILIYKRSVVFLTFHNYYKRDGSVCMDFIRITHFIRCINFGAHIFNISIWPADVKDWFNGEVYLL